MATPRRGPSPARHDPAPTPLTPPSADPGPAPQSDYVLVVRDGRPLPIRTRLVGGPQDGRIDSWFTFAPEDLPDGWVFPRPVQTAEGKVLVGDFYRMRPGQVPAHAVEVIYNYEHTGLIDQAQGSS